MRARGWCLLPLCLLSLALLLGSGSPAHADGPGDGMKADPAVEAEMLKILRVRMEARLEHARLLLRAGATEDALAMLAAIEKMHADGMAEIKSHRRLRAARRAKARADLIPETPEEITEEVEDVEEVPFEGPKVGGTIGIGAGAGGAFKGRGGVRANNPNGKRYADAVDNALRWLAAHQAPNGGWEAKGFRRWCDGKPVAREADHPDGEGKAVYDVGVTGLALCAFLGAGYTNRGRHPYAKVVSRGLRYLKNVQDPEGCFGPRASQQYVYNHATAALAMVEAYGMTSSPIFKGSAQRALDFIALARNPYFAWRYGIKPGDNDTSVSGWMMMPLKSAQMINKDAIKRGQAAPLTIDEGAFHGLKAWLEKVTDKDYGRVGYVQRGTGPARPMELVDRFPGEKSESMTAIGVLGRIFLGEDPRKSAVIKKGADLMAKLPPMWNPADGSIDMYYWYYGTLAMFQVGGKHWRTWQRTMDKAMVQTQRQDTDFCQYKGSWDPIGPWGLDGGRVYSTALLCMCLQVSYRYARVFGGRGR